MSVVRASVLGNVLKAKINFKIHHNFAMDDPVFSLFSIYILYRCQHTLGVISQVKKSLNAEWTLMECNFFSKVTNQDGAR